MKSNMRSRSEGLRGKVIKSQWSQLFASKGSTYNVNIRHRETYSLAGERKVHVDYTVLLRSTSTDKTILSTDFGPVCVLCKTSDYLKADKAGGEPVGCSCTRCGSATLTTTV